MAVDSPGRQMTMRVVSSRVITRRGALQVGTLGGLGLSLPDILRWEARSDQKDFQSRPGPAHSVINIFLPGGMAHQDTFDPKPKSPTEYRGGLEVIDTRLPGIQFSSLLPRTATILDRVTLCRAVSHVLADHDAGVHQMYTGYGPSPAISYPSLGSVVAHEYGPRNDLPAYICVPGKPHRFAGNGYLSTAYGPFGLGSDPAEDGFAVKDLRPPARVNTARQSRARSLLSLVNERVDREAEVPRLQAIDSFYRQAYRMIDSPAARAAFDLSKEKPATREAYGNGAAGMRMLLARRLVEAGVRFVSLEYGTWDAHFNIAPSLAGQVPVFDHALAALVTDLDDRGLLETTLVTVTTEFGRTPRINKSAGRDHWARVFSVMLAGAGIRRGHVHGSSDLTASSPDTGALSPRDLLTTVYHQIGIVAEKELMAPGARPIEIVKGGRVVKELLEAS